MQVSLKSLIAAGISATTSRRMLAPFNVTIEEFSINTPVRAAVFVSLLVAHSKCLSDVEPNFYFRNPEGVMGCTDRIKSSADAIDFLRNPERLANRALHSIFGNGDEESGDGWKFRPRGIIPAVGREQYEILSQIVDEDLIAKPWRAAEDDIVIRGFGYIFADSGCLEWADASNIDLCASKLFPKFPVNQTHITYRNSLFQSALVSFRMYQTSHSFSSI